MTSLAAAEGFLTGFLERYINMAHIDATTEEVLCRPPAFSLAEDRRFWKWLCALVAVRSSKRPNAIDAHGEQRAVSSVRGDMISLYTAYQKLTGIHVAQDIKQECEAYNQQRTNVSEQRPKQQATFLDVYNIIRSGIFSPQVQMRLWRERLQCASLLLLLAYTAARPGELVRNPEYNDALKWKDVTFFLTLITRSDGRTGYRLSCDVRIRNLKGARQNDSEFRVQPLYMSESLAFCMEATALLAILATEAGLFGSVDVIAIVNGSNDLALSASLFPPGAQTVEIPVVPTVVDSFVFHSLRVVSSRTAFESSHHALFQQD